jgi:hypothetical protein
VRGGRWALLGVAVVVAVAASTASAVPRATAGSARAVHGGRVLLVGTYHGHRGRYPTIQAAVDAARQGDWILVAPGDYHEADDATNPPTSDSPKGAFGGVVIATPKVHVRGMNRATVIVDGTKPDSSTPCSADPGLQNFGAPGSDGAPNGRNGIVVSHANGVSVENLTVCNFLKGSDGSGNEIWWNGGYDSGTVALTGYRGSYLTTTSTYYGGESSAAAYGIFASNAGGPARLDQVYASNFSDAGLYVGACLQVCDLTVDHAWMEYSALGYSGTNSGGAIVITNSEFDNNKDGLDTNTEISEDPLAPQNGACPGSKVSPITRTHSCWVFMHNNVHDNNNPNVPQTGVATLGPTGTGVTISGGRNDTVMDNTFANNGAWGVLVFPYPDTATPVLGQSCTGVGGVESPVYGCVLESQGNAVLNNTFTHNAFFGNPSNADIGQIVFEAHGQPRNCYRGNRTPAGTVPSNLQRSQPTCGPPTTTADTGGALLGQLICDAGFGPCPAGANYPTATGVVMHALPKRLRSMPNPCRGVPSNPWCADGKPV